MNVPWPRLETEFFFRRVGFPKPRGIVLMKLSTCASSTSRRVLGRHVVMSNLTSPVDTGNHGEPSGSSPPAQDNFDAATGLQNDGPEVQRLCLCTWRKLLTIHPNRPVPSHCSPWENLLSFQRLRTCFSPSTTSPLSTPPTKQNSRRGRA